MSQLHTALKAVISSSNSGSSCKHECPLEVHTMNSSNQCNQCKAGQFKSSPNNDGYCDLSPEVTRLVNGSGLQGLPHGYVRWIRDVFEKLFRRKVSKPTATGQERCTLCAAGFFTHKDNIECAITVRGPCLRAAKLPASKHARREIQNFKNSALTANQGGLQEDNIESACEAANEEFNPYAGQTSCWCLSNINTTSASSCDGGACRSV